MNKRQVHIAFFPLNILLLPGEQVPLHIFEPRYRQLFEEAEKQQIRFALPFEDKDLNVHLASICKLEKVTKRYESGESDVIVECESLGRVVDYQAQFPKKLYPGGTIEMIDDLKMDVLPGQELLSAFIDYIELRYGKAPSHSSVAHYRFADIAASTALSNRDKLRLVITNDQEVREKTLLNVIRYLNILLKQEQSIENGIILN